MQHGVKKDQVTKLEGRYKLRFPKCYFVLVTNYHKKTRKSPIRNKSRNRAVLLIIPIAIDACTVYLCLFLYRVLLLHYYYVCISLVIRATFCCSIGRVIIKTAGEVSHFFRGHSYSGALLHQGRNQPLLDLLWKQLQLRHIFLFIDVLEDLKFYWKTAKVTIGDWTRNCWREIC